MSEHFMADANGDGLPVRVLYDGQAAIVKVWLTEFPDVTVTLDVVPEDDPDYTEKVYAQNVLIINLYQIILDLIEKGPMKITDMSHEPVTDESIQNWLNDAE